MFSSTTKDESYVETSLELELLAALVEPDCEDFEEGLGLKSVLIAFVLLLFSKC